MRDQKHIVQQLGLLRDENLFRQNIQLLGATLDTAHTFDIEPSDSVNLDPQTFDIQKPLNQLAANVSRIQYRLQNQRDTIKRKDIARQWKRSCRQFLKRQQQLLPSPSHGHWHALRKSSKLLEYQMRFLRKYSHHAAGPLAELIIDLGKHLGQLNDFAKASESITKRKTPMGNVIMLNDEAAEELLGEIEQGCDQEMKAALELIEQVLPILRQLTELKSRELIE
jgi:CHAD domain-containing protein